MEEKEDNDLTIPLSFNNRFTHFIFRNKPLNKVPYNAVIVCFLVGGLVMLSISIYMFAVMATVTQITVNYYKPNGSTCISNGTCNIAFTVSQ